MLGHRDRTRVLPEELRRAVMPGYSMVHATVLVGFVAATWTVEGDDVVVRALRRLTAAERATVLAKGEKVRRFVADADGEVRLA